MNESAAELSEKLVREGLSFHKSGRIDRAVDFYRSAIEAYARNVNARYLLGVACMDAGHTPQAVALLNEVAREWPSSEKVLKALSMCHGILGNAGLGQSLESRHDEVLARRRQYGFVVFGDSHSEYCFSGIPDCVHHLVGYYTMHRIGRDGTAVLDIRNYEVRTADTVVFIFGEIDVRMHIGRQRDERGRDVQEIIDDLTKRYFRTISENAEHIGGGRIVVSSVVPPSDRHPQEIQPKHGTLSDRVLFSRLLNGRIKVLSRQHGFAYLDLFTPFAREDGTMNPVFSGDTVHVNKEFHRIVELSLRSSMLEMGWPAPGRTP